MAGARGAHRGKMSTFSPTPIPRIRTARLLLREPRLEDFAAFAAQSADPQARTHTGGPNDARESWRRFHACAGAWLVEGMGWWTVEEPEAGWVGSVGVFRRETGPALEIGWFMERSRWGQGYATEAARAALDYAFEAWGAERVIAHIMPGNAASIRVAEKIGMHHEGEVDFYGERDLLFARTR
jgi:RimJ/RimL family protein N-acetyltransferase